MFTLCRISFCQVKTYTHRYFRYCCFFRIWL